MSDNFRADIQGCLTDWQHISTDRYNLWVTYRHDVKRGCLYACVIRATLNDGAFKYVLEMREVARFNGECLVSPVKRTLEEAQELADLYVRP